MKKVIVLFLAIMFSFSPITIADDDNTRANQKLERQIKKLLEGQEEILKEIKDLKEQMRILKIRVHQAA